MPVVPVGKKIWVSTGTRSVGTTKRILITIKVLSDYTADKEGDFASVNHPMQYGFAAWFYHGICGIEPDSPNPGFKHFFDP